MRSLTNAALVSAAALLNACASMHVRDDMTAGLQRLVGHDIQDAIERLGYPALERQVAGEVIYTWHGRRWAGAMYLPRASADAEGTEPTAVVGTPVTHGPQLHSTCDIQIATGRNGRIRGYEWEGNSGCRLYVDRLLR